MLNRVLKPAILVVDDTPENLDVLVAALQGEYEVRPAINGALALRLAVANPQPELILLDIVMPGMDGYEVCRQLKKNSDTKEIPVIFVTAKVDTADELEGLSLGAVDYITKPFSPAIVRARVQTHLALRYFHRELQEKNDRLCEINERLTDSMEQLSSSKEQFRSLVQTIPDIVYRIDVEGNFTFLNKAIERLGYHQADLLGKHFSTIIHSADIQDVSLQDVLEKMSPGITNPAIKVFDERRTGTRLTKNLELRLRSNHGEDGKRYELRNTIPPTVSVEVNSTGLYGDVAAGSSARSRQYIGTVGVIRDITERLEIQYAFLAERKLLRQLIDTVPLPIFFIENHGQLIFANDAFQQLVGIRDHNLEGLNLDDLFCSDDYSNIRLLAQTLLTGSQGDRIRQEQYLHTGDRKQRIVEVILLRFQRSEETLPAVIGVLVDVSEQKAFASELIQAKRHAEQMAEQAKLADLAKGHFLANMSHEIRTPLNAVIGLTHLCLQTTLTAQQRDYLLKVGTSANALLHLLNDILDSAKIESGRLTMEHISFVLDDVLGGVATIMNFKALEKGLELLVDIREGGAVCLRGDPHRLGQVLTNLVGNAIKFTAQGEVLVRTEVVEETPEELFVCFSVRDTGIGMTPEQVGQLFQDFHQGDASITRRYGGTGLGLSISKRLVTLMGGTIQVDSELGHGSFFQFTIRFTKEVAPARMPIMDDAVELPRGLSVLVVDDNGSTRQVLASYLESLHCHPTCVASGEQALATLVAGGEQFKWDLVLMDWKMPGMNGLETARRIKKELSLVHTPAIIMVTAHHREEMTSMVESKEVLDGVLLKPVRRALLEQAILQVFGLVSTGPAVRQCSNVAVRLAGSRVLLVEDNDINRQVARELLEQVGVTVITANNGQEAIELLGQEQVDAVLMDLQMPVMDGLIATQRLRQVEVTATLPIIAMTAGAMVGDREKCLASGMNDHITKPVLPEKLYTTLEKWIQPATRCSPRSAVLVPATDSVFSHIPVPSLPGVDVVRGVRNVGDNARFYQKILLQFARNHGGSCQLMERCWAAGDASGLEHAAHALRGIAVTVGAIKIANLAEKIEKQAKNPAEWRELPDELGTMASELARVVAAIETTLGHVAAPVATTTQQQDVVTIAELAPLFRQAVALLQTFDSAVEMVVAQIAPLACTAPRLEKMTTMQRALQVYDFEGCLRILQQWAQEEGIELES